MKYKILALFANHTNNKIKYNISLNNISCITKYVSNIIIIDTENEYYADLLKKDLESTNLISNYFYIKNDHFYDFGKWTFVLEKINLSDYDYILFLNDSIILTDAVEKYFHYIETMMSPDTNLYAYNDSTQIKYHYQSYLFLMKSSSISKFLNFFESKKQHIHNLETLIKNIELNMCNIDNNHDVFIKIGNEYNYEKNLYWHNEELYQYLLDKDIFAIIKLKKIFDIQRDYKITIYGDSINDFDYKFYKENYDLQNMSDEDVLKHFVSIGQYEGRKPNNNFNVILPKYYRDKLDNLGILYLFDIPNDFDIYYYKKNNPDIETLSIIDTIYHYINYGYYEERKYNKHNNKNAYLNNYYLKILSKIENINNICLPHNFSLYSALFLNNYVDKYEYYGIIKEYSKNNNILYQKDLFNKMIEKFDLNTYKRNVNLEKNDLIHILQHYINNNKINIDSKLPLDFNHEIYKKIYNDLSKFSNQELEKHYILYGIKENRIYKLPDDFNPELYKKIYNDLSMFSDEELKNHYLFKGVIEKRVYNLIDNCLINNLPHDFNPNIYKKIYTELSIFSEEELKNHYLNIGINEKKIYKLPDDFNLELYKKIYNDLVQLNDKELKEHYLFYGIKEKRIYKIPDDFDVNFFKKLNKDLAYLNDEDIKEYYLLQGLKENRIYKLPDDFNADMYKKIYKDLFQLNNEQLLNHYVEYGLKEKRMYKLPDDFNADMYKKIYKDLAQLNNEQLAHHFIENGINEKRIYKLPDDFNSDMYKKLYKDLNDLSHEELIDHYLFKGVIENRIYKIMDDFNPSFIKRINVSLNHLNDEELKNYFLENYKNEEFIYKIPHDFNPQIYKKIYSDISNMNDENLINHYLIHGFKEKRIYKLPDDFNPHIYKKLYKDLNNLNDNELINHYLYNGVREKRKYK